MAENSNYIGIAMGIDVTDLKAGLSEANKQIQLSNSEFKAASSGMDDWRKSTDGINAKIKQLDSVLSSQKSKLAGLQAEYDRVSAAQGENSEAARKLKIQINNQQSVVNSTEREFNNYKETLKGAENGSIDLTTATLKNGKAVQKMGKDLDSSVIELKKMSAETEKVGKGFDGLKGFAGGVAKGFAAIGTAAAGAVTGFFATAGATREYREDMAKLQTGFQTAGFSAEQATDVYKSFFSILGEEDRSVEAVNHLAKLTTTQEELNQWTDIAAGVWGTFGDSLPIEGLTEAANETAKVGKVTGPLADALNWAGVSEDEFNAKLAACNTEQERASLITNTLNGLYADAATKYKEVNKDVMDAQRAQSELTDATAQLGAVAEPIMTTLKLLAAELLQSIMPFVKLIGEGLTGAFNGTAGAAATFAEGLGGILNILIERFTNMLPTILTMVLQLAPSLVTGLLSQLPLLLDTITSLAVQIINMLAQILPQIVTKIMEILPILVTKLISATPLILQAAIKLLMGIIQAIPILISSLLWALPSIIQTIISTLISNTGLIVNAGVQLFLGLIKSIPIAISSILRSIPSIISAIVTGLLQGIPQIFSVGVDLIKGLWNGIKSMFGDLKNKIVNFGKSIGDWFKKAFKIKSPSRVMRDEVGRFIGEGIGIGILDSLPTVKKDISQFNRYISDNIGGIKSGLNLSIDNISGGRGGISNRGGGATANNNVINAGLTVQYNGNLSRKQIKQLENDNYTSIKMRLKSEGAI